MFEELGILWVPREEPAAVFILPGLPFATLVGNRELLPKSHVASGWKNVHLGAGSLGFGKESSWQSRCHSRPWGPRAFQGGTHGFKVFVHSSNECGSWKSGCPKPIDVWFVWSYHPGYKGLHRPYHDLYAGNKPAKTADWIFGRCCGPPIAHPNGAGGQEFYIGPLDLFSREPHGLTCSNGVHCPADWPCWPGKAWLVGRWLVKTPTNRKLDVWKLDGQAWPIPQTCSAMNACFANTAQKEAKEMQPISLASL